MNIGIDLGTTFSLSAAIGEKGNIMMIPDLHFRQTYFTPSIVHINKDVAYVGEIVEPLLIQNLELNVIRFFKRKLGEEQPIYYDNEGTAWFSESVAALVLKKLRHDAEIFLGDTVTGAVITIPAHFNDIQRKAVVNSAYLAGIPIQGLIEEPVAAALHYGITNHAHDRIILVYDLGGGTFDVSLVSINQDGIFVIAKDGLLELGGKEFDEQIGDLILKQYKDVAGIEIPLTAKNLLHLRRISEQIKIELSSSGLNAVKKTCLLGGIPLDVFITRKEFETQIEDFLVQTEGILLRCIKGANLAPQDIDIILLVGGSSLIPTVHNKIKSIFHRSNQSLFYFEPMKAIVSGAALHSIQLDGKSNLFDLPPVLKGVSGYNVGVKTIDPRTGRMKIDVLIRKNIPLPIESTKTYFTARSNQKFMTLEFVQYIDNDSEIIRLGNLTIGPFEFAQQNYPVEVSVKNLADGTIQVKAYDPQMGKELKQTFGKDIDNGNDLLLQKALVNSTIINNI
jgi:molecular chaperone DnaK (HSP70)